MSFSKSILETFNTITNLFVLVPLRETVIELSDYYENVIKAIAVPVQKSV